MEARYVKQRQRKMLVHSREKFAQLGFEDTLTFIRTSIFHVAFLSVPLEEAAMPVLHCIGMHSISRISPGYLECELEKRHGSLSQFSKT